MIEFDGVPGPVVYPPLALYELSGLGRIYRAVNRGAFPNTVALTIAIKIPILLFEASLVWLIFVLVRRRAGTAAGRWAAVAYWLNPGAILASSMLGYIEAFFALPAVAAFAAAGAERPFLAGGLTFAAALTKPQAAILIPAAALAAWNGTGRRARGAVWFAVGAVVSTLAILAPVLRAHASAQFDVRHVAACSPRHAFRQRVQPVVARRLRAARRLFGWRIGSVAGAHDADTHPHHLASDRTRLSESPRHRRRPDARRDRLELLDGEARATTGS